jgi:hypothetical protein
MRRVLFAIVTGFSLGMLSGCCCNGSHTHGICDCDPHFDDPCYTRAPWAGHSGPVNVSVPVSVDAKQTPSAETPHR